jgi:hypothetical protein
MTSGAAPVREPCDLQITDIIILAAETQRGGDRPLCSGA